VVPVLAAEAFLEEDPACADLACVVEGHEREEVVVDHFEDCR
jgi:hypothetical protein